MEIHIDTALKFAEIISIISGGSIVAFKLGRVTTRVEENMKLQAKEISELKEETKKLGAILTTVAVQDNRIDRIESDIHDLKHGRGWVNPIVSP